MPEEFRLAFRNRGMPLEAMRPDLTPTGLHYFLAHWDIPLADPASWRLTIGGCVRRPLSEQRGLPAARHWATSSRSTTSSSIGSRSNISRAPGGEAPSTGSWCATRSSARCARG
jgi:hypothetical protein